MKKVFLWAMAALIALAAFRPANDFVVSGQVIDLYGNPIPFATVKIKGTNRGLSADQNGHFSISVRSAKDVLEISAAGFKTVEMPVGNLRNGPVVMERDGNVLKEVVVTGAYGVKRSMRSMGSSVQTVSSEQMNRIRSNNVNNALSGKVSGAQVYSQTTMALGRISTAPVKIDNSPIQQTNALGLDREGYDQIVENGFLKTTDNPLSTFSIDVDAASYSNLRRFLNDGQLPPPGAVRIEEMVNYFTYDYPQPAADQPFSVNTEIAACPWNTDHRLALVGLQGKIIPTETLPSSNIVFLIDVSGSMYDANKLPLVKQSLKMLVDQFREKDRVALCVYAGNAGLVLPSTNGLHKQEIKQAIDALEAGGSTAGGQGIQLAYKTAKENFIKGGNNRVILCTDGDFNVGMSSDDELVQLIEKERESGVYLTVLGFGTGNYQDAKMQKLADKGNGNHAYIDQLSEAKKVLVSEFGGTLFTIAKDVKLQIEFNPALVQGYRLIGYENRMLAKEDFNDDKKDAGELGSGHTVTALYEIIPVGIKTDLLKKVDTLKYQQPEGFTRSVLNTELMTIKLRYKQPDGNTSKLIEVPVTDQNKALDLASENFRFAAAVAEFGLLLRNSEFKQNAGFNSVSSLAYGALGTDVAGYRKEFLQLVQKASPLAQKAYRKKKIGIQNTEEESVSAVR